MRTCCWKRIIVYKYPKRSTVVIKNNTKTGHSFLIYICGHLIQNCFLISYYNNIAVIIVYNATMALGTNSFSSL